MDLRLLTTGCVMLLCVWTLAKGAMLLQFYAVSYIDDVRAQVDGLRALGSSVGVRRDALLNMSSASSDIDEKIAIDHQILAIAPLTTSTWLDLADLYRRSLLPDRALKAFSIASITGPNEGALMPSRVLIGVPLWPLLKEEDRRLVVRNLVTSWRDFGPSELSRLMLLLSILLSDDNAIFFSDVGASQEGKLLIDVLKLKKNAPTR